MILFTGALEMCEYQFNQWGKAFGKNIQMTTYFGINKSVSSTFQKMNASHDYKLSPELCALPNSMQEEASCVERILSIYITFLRVLKVHCRNVARRLTEQLKKAIPCVSCIQMETAFIRIKAEALACDQTRPVSQDHASCHPVELYDFRQILSQLLDLLLTQTTKEHIHISKWSR